MAFAGELGVGDFSKNGVVLAGDAGNGLFKHGKIGITGAGIVGTIVGQGRIGGSTGFTFSVSRKCFFAS